jgi:succinate-semialdehyde dehydrogenase/glutarate-semialdehyde dehydrogenase
MSYISVNPYSGEQIFLQPYDDETITQHKIDKAYQTSKDYSQLNLKERIKIVNNLADILEKDKTEIAIIITNEMGKLYKDSIAEVNKSIATCRYYANNAEEFLADEVIKSDAKYSFVQFAPIGVVLAVMPWNFPLWQVIRFLAPALIAGNVALLKHASNVGQMAIKLATVVKEAYPEDELLQNLMIAGKSVAKVIANPKVSAITLTGSEGAGRSVAEVAGRNLKKTVLELGGSDAFVVLEDADIDKAVNIGLTARFLNAGQSCIAAKRFILTSQIYDEFIAKMSAKIKVLNFGDPMLESSTMQTMARADLVSEIKEQVDKSVKMGANIVIGGNKIPGSFAGFEPTILENINPNSPAYQEELFGPVISAIKVKDGAEALQVANDSPFGLGSSVWTKDLERGVNFARKIEAGASFVNGLTKSDARLPFGGVKNSGFGRELSRYGLLEFVNIKTIWVGK